MELTNNHLNYHLIHQSNVESLFCGEQCAQHEGQLGLPLTHGVQHRVLEPEWGHDTKEGLIKADGELGPLHHSVVAAQGQQAASSRTGFWSFD